MAKRGRLSRFILVILILLFFCVAGGLCYLYILGTQNAESKNVVMTLNLDGGKFESALAGYTIDGLGNYLTLKKSGESFGALPTPTKAGYKFLGWVYDSFSTDYIKSTDIVEFEDDFTLIAKWETEVLRDYYIYFYDENGNEIKDFEMNQAPNNAEVTVTPPSINGYTFDETKSELTKVIGLNTIFHLYYTANVYEVQYARVGQNYYYANNTTFKYGTEFTLTPISEIQANDSRFVINGYDFDCWLVNGQTVQDGATITKEVMEDLLFSTTYSTENTNVIIFDAQYKEKQYTLTYICQGIEFGTQDFKYGEFITPLNSPNIDGYTFKGWYSLDTGATGTQIDGKTAYNFAVQSMPNNDFTLYAGFTLIEYNLTLNIGDGYWEGGVNPNPAIYTVESDFILSEPIQDGYSFYGWYGEGISESEPQTDLHIYQMTGNRTYYAKFGEARYTIEYNLNGGELPDGESNPQYYMMSTKTFTLVNPVKDGYIFAGWEGTDIDGVSTNVVIEQGSFGDRIYTATYTAIDYNINYNTMGGTFELLPKDTYTIEDIPFSLATPIRNGYTFVGWIYNGETLSLDFVFDPKAYLQDVDFIADWSLDTYSISYDIGDGYWTDGDNPNPLTYTVEDETFTIVNPTMDGYKFLGWTGSNGEEPNDNLVINKGGYFGNLSFVANFEIIEYSISYELNGGTPVSELPTSYTAKTPTFTIPQLTKEGYEFMGWRVNEEDEPNDNYEIAEGTTGNIVLTAVFAYRAYTINLVLSRNGMFYGAHLPADWDKGNPFTYTIDTPTFTLPQPTLNGYSFVGWTLEDQYDTSAPINVTISKGSSGDRTYYAWFLQGIYTIEYDLGENGEWGENPTNPSTYKSTDGDITPSDPVRVGYDFAGWELYDENGDLIDGATIKSGSSGNRKFVATWTKQTNIPYNVIYYTMNVNGQGYTASKPETRYGTTDTLVSVTAEEKVGFTLQESMLYDYINGDGSTVFEFYYDRNSYNVVVGDAKGITIKGAGTYFYGQQVVLIATNANGYGFGGYFDSAFVEVCADTQYEFTMGVGDVTLNIESYLIDFNIDYNIETGAVLEEENPTTYTVETPTFTLNNPSLEGSTFKGWTGTGIGDNPIKTVTINQGSFGDRSYTAVFGYDEYTITYEFNGGREEVGGYYPKTYTRVDEIRPDAPVRDGYIFTGWTLTDAQGTVLPKDYITVGSTGARKFTANWTARGDVKYVVNIYLMNADGTYNAEPYETKTYNNGTTGTIPYVELSDFDGYITPSLSETPVAGDGSTIYNYYYERMTYHLTIEKDNGITVVSGSGDYRWGASVSISAVVGNGYSFNAWTQTAGTSVGTLGNNSNTTFTMPKDNITIKATSSAVEYTIDYIIGDGQWEGGSNPNPLTYTIESDDIIVVNPVKTGYSFAGWTGTDLTKATTSLVIPKGSTGNRVYTANYEVATTQYTVRNYLYNIDGETYEIDEYTETAVAGTSVTPSMRAYVGFVTPELQSKVIEADGSTVFEFKYYRIKYTITLEATRGIGTVGDTLTYYYGETVNISATLKEYYVFNGWYIGDAFLASNLKDSFKLDEAFVTNELYKMGANYEYTITANTSGQKFKISYTNATEEETANLPTEYEYGYTTMLILSIKRPSYEFLGWQIVGALDKRSGIQLTIGETYHEDITLKAHWGQSINYLAFGKLSDGTVCVGQYYNGVSLPKDVVIPDYVYFKNGDVVDEGSGQITILAIAVDEEFYTNGNARTYEVTTIRGGAYDGTNPSFSYYSFYQSNIDSITIPNTITNIGVGSFYNSQVKSVIFEGSSVTTIGAYAFSACLNLASISIPNSVTTLGDRVFASCLNLSNVTIGSGITEIPKYLFYDCQSLRNITIPSNITTINEGAFYMCTNLNAVTFNEGLQSIGFGAFQKTKLQEIALPASLKTIGNNAFQYLTTLTNVTFASNSGLTQIGDSAFSYNFNLKTINIPDTIQRIGDYAFSECIRLYDVGMSGTSKLSYLGENAFQDCSSLIELRLDTSASLSIGNQPLNLCYNLRKLITNKTFTETQWHNDTIDNLEIKSSNSGFSGTIEVRTNGVVLWKTADEVMLINYRGDEPVLDLSSDTTITAVGPYAFYNNNVIEKLDMSDSVTDLYGMAFANANNLVRVWIPAGKALHMSNSLSLFGGSYKLVQIYTGGISITDGSMPDCEYLTGEGQTEFTRTSFGTYNSPDYGLFETVTYNSGSNAGTYLLNYRGTSSVIDLNKLPYAPYSGLFFNNYNVQQVIMPTDMAKVPDAMFGYAVNLKTIELPSTVQSIGRASFSNALSLTTVNWDDLTNLTSFDIYSFNLCASLTEIKIPSKVTVLPAYSFRGCFNATLTLNDGLQRIEAYALQSLTLPNDFEVPTSVTYIDENAFLQCKKEDGSDYVPPFTSEPEESSINVNYVTTNNEENETTNFNSGLLKNLLFA